MKEERQIRSIMNVICRFLYSYQPVFIYKLRSSPGSSALHALGNATRLPVRHDRSQSIQRRQQWCCHHAEPRQRCSDEESYLALENTEYLLHHLQFNLFPTIVVATFSETYTAP